MRYYTEKASRELRKQFELEVLSWSQVSTRRWGRRWVLMEGKVERSIA